MFRKIQFFIILPSYNHCRRQRRDARPDFPVFSNHLHDNKFHDSKQVIHSDSYLHDTTLHESKQGVHDDSYSGIYEEIASISGDGLHTYETLQERSHHYLNGTKPNGRFMPNASANGKPNSVKPGVKKIDWDNLKSVVSNGEVDRKDTPTAPPLPKSNGSSQDRDTVVKPNGFRH